jgi:chemotaxis protein MotB
MSQKARKKRSHEEEHENSERWLVTYADMLTLLMVLFIVLFAMSQVDQKKFALLKEGLEVGFGANAVTITTDSAPLSSGGAADTTVAAMDPAVNPGLTGGGTGTNVNSDKSPSQEELDKAATQAVKAMQRSQASQQAADVQSELNNLKAAQQKIAAALKEKGLANAVQFNIDKRGLVITVISSDVVFAGDRADLLSGGQRIVDAIDPTIRALPNNIEVDGHTNQLPVPTKYYPSAWELSTARASTVARYLVDHGVAGSRLTAAGFAGFRPLYPPSDPRAVARNRRVDIVVLTALSSSESDLLAATAGQSS